MSDGLLRLRDEAFPLCQPANIYENLFCWLPMRGLGFAYENSGFVTVCPIVFCVLGLAAAYALFGC